MSLSALLIRYNKVPYSISFYFYFIYLFIFRSLCMTKSEHFI